jgi:hypothetical protein
LDGGATTLLKGSRFGYLSARRCCVECLDMLRFYKDRLAEHEDRLEFTHHLLVELARDFHTKEELLHYAKGFVLAMGSREFYRSRIEAFETVEATRKGQ